MDDRKTFGKKGERAAAAFLQEKGVQVLVTNYRCRTGEIDIIAREDGCLLVIEVKSRNSHKQGFGAEAVHFRKQYKICRAFDYFRMVYRLPWETPVRFDVIETDQDYHCHWIRNAFSYVESRTARGF